MTKEGRMIRGEANYKAKKFLDNSETMAYAETLKDTPKETPKDVKPNK